MCLYGPLTLSPEYIHQYTHARANTTLLLLPHCFARLHAHTHLSMRCASAVTADFQYSAVYLNPTIPVS